MILRGTWVDGYRRAWREQRQRRRWEKHPSSALEAVRALEVLAPLLDRAEEALRRADGALGACSRDDAAALLCNEAGVWVWQGKVQGIHKRVAVARSDAARILRDAERVSADHAKRVERERKLEALRERKRAAAIRAGE